MPPVPFINQLRDSSIFIVIYHSMPFSSINQHSHPSILHINSLAPGKFAWNFRQVIFKQIIVIDGWGISCEIVLIWMSLDFTDDQSTLVQVMAWCRQATSHYLNLCWSRSLLPYGITKPLRVNTLRSRQNGRHFPDNIFNCIFLIENVWISLKFVPKGVIDNMAALVQIMAWPLISVKPLSEVMLVSWTETYMHYLASMS